MDNNNNSNEQLILKLDAAQRSDLEIDYFITQNNKKAYDLLIKHSIASSECSAILLGEGGSGKTHLSNIWKKKNNALLIKNPRYDIFQVEDSEYHGAILYEDIDKKEDEQFLFHLINFCSEYHTSLLLTCCAIPITKIEDLNSRLRSMQRVSIDPISEDLLSVILFKSFVDKQIHINEDVLNYIVTRIPRSFSSVKHVVSILDKESLAHHRQLTIPFVKAILSRYRY